MFLLRFLTGLSVGLAVGAFLLALRIISLGARMAWGFFIALGIPFTLITYAGGGWAAAWKSIHFHGGAAAIFIAIDFVASFIYYRITEPNGPESWK
ncbi:hypothetical protein [Azospirillum thermophilum]|uniref:hypothetical protein n=1 Tax=Azospirillum thermophilum TaxID=2202148 RepID=UPI0011B46FBB|nr:hypothetical protein [Azospirillum thermophilum]